MFDILASDHSQGVVPVKFLIGLLVVMFALSTGCALFETSPDGVRHPGRETVQQLETAFNRGDHQAILQLVYPQAEISPPDLQADLREVFRVRRGIRLEIHSTVSRHQEGSSELHLISTWNLTWRLQEDDRIQRRRGRTVFELHNHDGKWLIYNQSGDPLLGVLEPGECLEGC